MSLANVALTNTFDEWRIRTNQLVTEVNDINSNVALRFISNNSVLNITTAPLRKGNVYIDLAFSTGTSDTATNNIAAASSVNTVSNLAVAAAINSNNAFNKANAANLLAFNTGIGTNAFTSATIAGANTAVGAGANAYANLVWSRSNTYADTIGTSANAFTSATIAGANTTVGAGANAYANLVWSRSNTYADAVGVAANAFTSATIAGANTAVGAGANAYANLVWSRSNTRSDTVLFLANLAFDKANSGNLLAHQANLNATYANTLANSANTLATSTLSLAITANNVANSANFTAIEALRIANLAVGNNTPALALAIAQSAYDFANTANIMAFFANNTANAAFRTANAASANASAAFDKANAANVLAFSALPNSTVTLAGSLESTGYINATSGFYSTTAGTPARPSISWKNDIHTGLSRPSSNTLTISTAAAGRIHIDSNGYIGIGTSSPTRLLDVTGNTNQSFTGLGSISGNVMTITSVISGQLAVGNYISDEDVSTVGGTYIKDFWTGSGGLGTYNITTSQTISSTTLYGYNLNNSSIRLTSSDSSINIGQPIGMIEFASDDADLTTDERARAFIYAVNEQANAGATLMFGTAVGAREAQERLRINRFGAIGLGGRNFGTAGQVLASNGSTNSVEWINNPGIGSNAFTSATIAGANTAVGTGANAFTSATIAGANTAVGAGSNAFTSATIAGANTAVGTAANNFARATIAGANTAVGAGANTVGVAAFVRANNSLLSSSYTASDVLSKLLTVDGASSGLDADLLDGQHGSFYSTDTKATAAFGQANTALTTGQAAFSTANAALANTSGVSFNGNLNFPTGNVGIGTTSPLLKLDVSGSSTQGIRVISTDTSGSNIAYFTAQHGSGSSLQLRSGVGYTYLLSTSAVPLYMGTNAAIHMTVDASGNVLVGRTTSTVGQGIKLDVNGGINASAVLVNGSPIESGISTGKAIAMAIVFG